MGSAARLSRSSPKLEQPGQSSGLDARGTGGVLSSPPRLWLFKKPVRVGQTQCPQPGHEVARGLASFAGTEG